jgi:hypothetical protein
VKRFQKSFKINEKRFGELKNSPYLCIIKINQPMSKTLVHITTQYSENYGTFENPHWKFKGEKLFSLYVDADDFMYGEKQCVKAIDTLLDKQSNTKCRYEYCTHELIFSNITALDTNLFEQELEKERELL